MEERIYEQLRKVVDPEIGFDVVALGLIYGIQAHDGAAKITMTLSTRACPLHELMISWVKEAALKTEGIKSCEIALVWEPAWNISMADENVQKALK